MLSRSTVFEDLRMVGSETAYERGRLAFESGMTHCPYKKRKARTRWWTGWLDARTEKRMGWSREQWGDTLEEERNK